MATVKSDTLHTVILRGFEFALREAIQFRAGPHATGKKGAPQVKQGIVHEQKVPVNLTLYGGTQHKAELVVTVPPHHTTTSMSSARHIDITYVLTAKALMGTGQPLVMDLPVIISNWPRTVSIEAVRRIGIAPNVANPQQSHSSQTQQQPQNVTSPTTTFSVTSNTSTTTSRPSISNHPISTGSTSLNGSADASRKFSTAPLNALGGYRSGVDEFGFDRARAVEREQIQTIGGTQVGGTASIQAYTDNSSSSGARPRSSSGREHPEEAAAQQAASNTHVRQSSLQTRPSVTATATNTTTPKPSNTNKWASAEEEKRKLYETAVAKVEQAQAAPLSPSSDVHSTHSSNRPSTAPGSNNAHKKWLTAEEEKERLFKQAQAAVQRAQGQESEPSSPTLHGRSLSASASAQQSMSSAALYTQAMSSVHRNVSAGPSSGSNPKPVVKAPTPQYPSADQEKAALRRYEEARAAVERNQGAFETPGDGPSSEEPPPTAPISYDALFPPNNVPPVPSTNGVYSNGAYNNPPAFQTSSSSQSQPSYITEKEKLRRAYEAQDAAALSVTKASPAISAVGGGFGMLPSPQSQQQQTFSPPPTNAALPPSSNPVSEKELLRRRFEAQDAAAAGAVPSSRTPPTPPPRTARSPGNSLRAALPTPRSPPIPPAGPSGFQPLTAAEEKARLKAMYDSEHQQQTPQPYSQQPLPPANGAPPYMVNGTTHSYSPAVPPLAPRPPKEYIQETQEEDARTHAKLQALDVAGAASVALDLNGNPALTLRPFSPFTPGAINGLPSPAPMNMDGMLNHMYERPQSPPQQRPPTAG
ncbi:hypothetical protein C8Q75DRAFT_2414 [Abortiporus biennis]|nr:hypothetical protein C8Q75DRAFT_2414 [Abortiporus biennis]